MVSSPKMLGRARLATGVVMFLAPSVVGRIFAGPEGASAGAEVFVRGYGAREIALGAGLITSGSDPDAGHWLGAILAADVADAIACLLAFNRLPRRHASAAMTASVAPAVVETLLLIRHDRSRRQSP